MRKKKKKEVYEAQERQAGGENEERWCKGTRRGALKEERSAV